MLFRSLVHGMRTVARGGSYLGAQVSQPLLRLLQSGASGSVDEPRRRLPALTRREQEVLRLVASGQTSKEVATELNLGVETIRTYRKTLMRKLGAANVASLTRIAMEAELATPLGG